MVQKNKHLRRYCRAVASWLPCSRREIKRIITGLEASIASFLSSAPTADFAALVAHFGTPQAVASALVDDMSTPEILHHLRVRRRIVKIVFLCALTVIAIWGIAVLIATINAFIRSGGTYSEYITVIR